MYLKVLVQNYSATRSYATSMYYNFAEKFVVVEDNNNENGESLVKLVNTNEDRDGN